MFYPGSNISSSVALKMTVAYKIILQYLTQLHHFRNMAEASETYSKYTHTHKRTYMYVCKTMIYVWARTQYSIKTCSLDITMFNLCIYIHIC